MSPQTIRQFCERATPGPWETHGPTHLLFAKKTGMTIADYALEPDGQLIARLSPDVVLKIVEALEISERYLFSAPLDGALEAHAKVIRALSLLNGQSNPPTQ